MNGKCVLANAHSESVKIFFLSFRWIPKSIVVTKENVAAVAEAIYLLEYKFLCSLSREPRWLLIIYFLAMCVGVSGKNFLSIFRNDSSLLFFEKNFPPEMNNMSRSLPLSSSMTMLLWLSLSGASTLGRTFLLDVSALSVSVSKFIFTTSAP